jgi:hypothetical protein
MKQDSYKPRDGYDSYLLDIDKTLKKLGLKKYIPRRRLQDVS